MNQEELSAAYKKITEFVNVAIAGNAAILELCQKIKKDGYQMFCIMASSNAEAAQIVLSKLDLPVEDSTPPPPRVKDGEIVDGTFKEGDASEFRKLGIQFDDC